MANRTLVISDIHGCYAEFTALLELADYRPQQDQLMLLGDYIDKGPQSKEVVDKVMQLVEQHGAIALRGNHDQRFVDLILGTDAQVESKFYEHGGLETMQSYIGHLANRTVPALREYVNSSFSHHISFLAKLPLYHEDSNHIYVHAGLNPKYSNWREQSDYDFMYIKQPFYNYPTHAAKPVIFGHTKTINIHGSPDIWFGGDKIAVDGGCSSGLQLNGLEISAGHAYKEHKAYAVAK